MIIMRSLLTVSFFSNFFQSPHVLPCRWVGLVRWWWWWWWWWYPAVQVPGKIVHCIMVPHNTVNLNKTLHKDCSLVNAVKALPVFLVINFRTFDHLTLDGPGQSARLKLIFNNVCDSYDVTFRTWWEKQNCTISNYCAVYERVIHLNGVKRWCFVCAGTMSPL